MGLVSVVAGALLLLLLVYDVFATVFVPRGGAGPVTQRVYDALWWAWRRAGDRLHGTRRRRFLALGGPVLLPLTVALWALELVLAFTLVYLPYAHAFQVEGPVEVSRLVRALYVSGISATTLGVGDVYPLLSPLRLLTTVEAALGFALFSASIAYVLSVYGALQQSTSLALEISRYIGTDDHQDPVDVLIDAVRHDRGGELMTWVSSVASQVGQASQAEAQYPLTAYFHVPDDSRGLPQSIGSLLELLTVARALLDPQQHAALTQGRALGFAFRAASGHVCERATDLSAKAPEPSDDERRARHDDARARLEQAGVALRPADQSCRDYVALRSTWDVAQLTMRSHFGYPPRT